MKPFARVDAADVLGVLAALRASLDGGPAVWPVPAVTPATQDMPATADAPTRGAPATGDVRASGDASAFGSAPATPHAAVADRPPAAPAPAALDASLQVDDGVALVVETSGSTDAPKRVLLSAAALRASAEATAERLEGHGRWLLALPAHYVAGAQVLVRSIVAGTEPVVLEGERFESDAFVAATEHLMRTRDSRPLYTSLVPVQLARVVEAAGGDREHPAARALRGYAAILIGGQTLAEPVRLAAESLGARIVRTYGSSETAGGCVYDGRPLPGVAIRIGADGVVELGGPTLADGYLADATRTDAVFTTDPGGARWYRTGDLGELSAEGVLRIRGRSDDVIISGGVKVALGEIERAIRVLPGMADAIAVATTDPEWGQRAVVVAPGASASRGGSDQRDLRDQPAALDRLAQAADAAGLPPAGRPVRLMLLDEWPMLASGKPDRRRIAALAESRGTPDVA